MWYVMTYILSAQDVKTYVNKKVCRHMNFRVHLRNTVKVTDKITFSRTRCSDIELTVLVTVNPIRLGCTYRQYVCVEGSD